MSAPRQARRRECLKPTTAYAKKGLEATEAPQFPMSSLKKACPECGMPLSVGVASCSSCGATVGTLFSESEAPRVSARGQLHRAISEHVDYHHRIEKAKERANNSVILALASFFCPGVGFLMGISAIILSVMAARTLKAENVEDGRGSATAGLVIGVLGLIAQAGYAVYVIKQGKLPFAE